MLPDQLAVGCIERLHDIGHVVEVQHAVVNDGRRLAAATLGHGPRPLQAQLADVVAIDLVERAIAPGRIVAPDHQPVVSRGIAQHLVGHRRVIWNRSFDGKPERPGGLRRRAGRRAGRLPNGIGHHAAGDAADYDWVRGLEWPGAWLGAVGAQQERDDVEVGLLV